MSVAMNVLTRVNRLKRGQPFPITGFYHLGSRSAVQKAVSRLSKQGVIERVSKGFYVRPKPLPSMPSIKTTASAEQVAKAWAKANGFTLVEQGLESAYRLGFQTQAPMTKVFWTNGPSREFHIGRQHVEVRHAAKSKLLWASSPSGALLRSLMVTPPSAVKPKMLEQAAKRLALSPTVAQSTFRRLASLPHLKSWQPLLKQLG